MTIEHRRFIIREAQAIRLWRAKVLSLHNTIVSAHHADCASVIRKRLLAGR